MLDTSLRIPPFNVRVRSRYQTVAAHLTEFYAQHPRLAKGVFVDFDIEIVAGQDIHRFWRPQARFLIDGRDHFLPLPATQAAPLFEWGLNWSIASRSQGFLVMHAAVLARGDVALVLPGFPGAGKSTLCASLAWLGGWRLLSDELAILDPASGELLASPRPICLKNDAIDVVRRFPGARLGPSYRDTRKGVISHCSPPPGSISDAERPARCQWVVFPQFSAGAAPAIEEVTRAEAFALISEQSFNRETMGETGFLALCRMLDKTRCFAIEYGSTADGLQLIENLCGPAQ